MYYDLIVVQVGCLIEQAKNPVENSFPTSASRSSASRECRWSSWPACRRAVSQQSQQRSRTTCAQCSTNKSQSSLTRSSARTGTNSTPPRHSRNSYATYNEPRYSFYVNLVNIPHPQPFLTTTFTYMIDWLDMTGYSKLKPGSKFFRSALEF